MIGLGFGLGTEAVLVRVEERVVTAKGAGVSLRSCGTFRVLAERLLVRPSGGGLGLKVVTWRFFFLAIADADSREM